MDDACARGGDTRRRASRQRWSQPCITAVMWVPRSTKPHGDRRRPPRRRRQGSRRSLAYGHRRPCLRGCGGSFWQSRCVGSSRVLRLFAWTRCICCVAWTDMCHIHKVRTTTTTTTRARTLKVDQQQCGRPAVCPKLLAAMADGAGAARRRRERRLRSWLRHERQTVAVALAEPQCQQERDVALRRQTTRAREGEVRETHYGLRAQERPFPGTRPAPLSVGVEPQDRLEAAARVSSGVPSVAPPALAAPAAEGVDTSTLRFLAAAALYSRKLEEEEVRKREEEEELQWIRNIPLNQLTPLQRQKLASWIEKRRRRRRRRQSYPALPRPPLGSLGKGRRRGGKGRGGVVDPSSFLLRPLVSGSHLFYFVRA